jgi:hypothetical protein
MDKTPPYVPGEGKGGPSVVGVEGDGEKKCFIKAAATTRVSTDCNGPLQPLSAFEGESVNPAAMSTTAVGLESIQDLLLSRGDYLHAFLVAM